MGMARSKTINILQTLTLPLFRCFSISAPRFLRLNLRVQLDLFPKAQRLRQPLTDWLLVAQRRLPLELVRNRHARRYILRVGRHGLPRVTIPRGGSATEAKRFAQKHVAWLEKQLLRQAQKSKPWEPWAIGTEIHFRGQQVR